MIKNHRCVFALKKKNRKQKRKEKKKQRSENHMRDWNNKNHDGRLTLRQKRGGGEREGG